MFELCWCLTLLVFNLCSCVLNALSYRTEPLFVWSIGVCAVLGFYDLASFFGVANYALLLFVFQSVSFVCFWHVCCWRVFWVSFAFFAFAIYVVDMCAFERCALDFNRMFLLFPFSFRVSAPHNVFVRLWLDDYSGFPYVVMQLLFSCLYELYICFVFLRFCLCTLTIVFLLLNVILVSCLPLKFTLLNCMRLNVMLIMLRLFSLDFNSVLFLSMLVMMPSARRQWQRFRWWLVPWWSQVVRR